MTGKKSGITKRWVLNTLCVIVVVLLGFVLVALMLFKEQYYEAVRMTLNSRATGMVQSYFDLSAVDSDEAFNMRAKEYVEDFNDKSIMEVWVIDRRGNVVVSSSGFSVANEVCKNRKKRTGGLGRQNAVGRTGYGTYLYAERRARTTAGCGALYYFVRGY